LYKPSLIVELKQEVKKELKRLRHNKLLGKENIGNVPLFQGGSNCTGMALNERTAI